MAMRFYIYSRKVATPVKEFKERYLGKYEDFEKPQGCQINLTVQPVTE